MSFPKEVKLQALIACRRNCVLCEKFCGLKIELHHIKQRAHGGKDTFENCIPLCFDCHSEVRMYNPEHPKGTKYSEEELIQRRDLFYQQIANNFLSHKYVSKEVAEYFETIPIILKRLFGTGVDVIGTIKGYNAPLVSYEYLRNNIQNCTPQCVDTLVKWLSEQGYVQTDIRLDFDGTICGTIRIRQEGINFYLESVGRE